MTFDEMMRDLAAARPATPSPKHAAKSLPSGAALSEHDKTLIKGLAPTVRELIDAEVAAAVAPLHARIRELETLVDYLLRPPCVQERRGHGDARGPHSFEWRQ
jgi:hypothetical protein